MGCCWSRTAPPPVPPRPSTSLAQPPIPPPRNVILKRLRKGNRQKVLWCWNWAILQRTLHCHDLLVTLWWLEYIWLYNFKSVINYIPTEIFCWSSQNLPNTLLNHLPYLLYASFIFFAFLRLGFSKVTLKGIFVFQFNFIIQLIWIQSKKKMLNSNIPLSFVLWWN